MLSPTLGYPYADWPGIDIQGGIKISGWHFVRMGLFARGLKNDCGTSKSFIYQFSYRNSYNVR
jgi:hypothetical protein